MNTNGNRLNFGQSKAIQPSEDDKGLKKYLRLIGYGRVSTDEQADPEKTSLQSQQEKNQKYAESIDAEIVLALNDDFTGTELSRPQLDVALRYLIENKADGIVCMTVDRFSRSVAVFMTLWTTLTRLNKQLHFADTGLADMSKLDSLILSIIRASMSQEERERIIKRMMGAKYTILDNGDVEKIIGIMGRVPAGYKKIKKYDEKGNLISKKLVVVPEEAKIIRKIFIWAAYGHTEGKPLSTMDICRLLNSQGITFNEFQERTGFFPSRINKILHNPFYAGVYVWNRRKNIKEKPNSPRGNRSSLPKHNRIERPQEEWYIIDLPQELAIIDIETWNRVQEQLKKNKKESKRNTKVPFMLAGHLICGSCGRVMTSYYSSYRSKTGSQEYYSYRRYQCTAKNLIKAKVRTDESGYRTCLTPYKTISAAKVEFLTWEWLKWILSDSENLKSAIDNIRKKTDYDLLPKKQHLDATIDRMAQIEKSLAKTMGRMAKEDDDEIYAQLNQYCKSLKSELKDLENQKSEINNELLNLSISEEQIEEIWLLYDKIKYRLQDEEQLSVENIRFILDFLKVKVVFYYTEEKGTPKRKIKLECMLGEPLEKWFDVDDDNNYVSLQTVYPIERSTVTHNIRVNALLDMDLPYDVTEDYNMLFSRSITSVTLEQRKVTNNSIYLNYLERNQ